MADKESIHDLRNKIQQVRDELDMLGDPPADIPEMIESANLLRTNEYLTKVDEKKTILLDTFEQYSGALEDLISSVFEIQHDLKEILRIQSSMIAGKKQTRSKK